jgi:6-phosphogluconolactonase
MRDPTPVTSIASRDVRTFSDLDALSSAAADEIVAIARASVAARGRFTMALAGGNTPRRTYELLATRHRDAIDWARTDIVFGDERFVPADDARSNYKMAREALFSRVPIPRERVHAVPTGAPTPEAAAAAYDQTLKALVGPVIPSEARNRQRPDRGPSTGNLRIPRADALGMTDAGATADLVLLGVGPDGHTASLFPGSPAVEERARYAVAVAAPTAVQPAVPRVTATLPFLNGARTAMFLITGADKRPVVAEILSGAESARRYPAAMVASRERTIWLIDRTALPVDRSNT